jgi:cold shock CspA family protein/ribosome-associated translation inhibitor RaiA
MRVNAMQLPLQISFHNMPHSADIEERVLEHAATLDEFYSHVMSCRVVVDMPHRHHRRGNLYQVRIDIMVPGEEIAVNRETGEHTAYKDIEVAIRDAFNSAVRMLEDYARRRRGQAKVHHPLPHARVAKLFPEAHYGFLGTPEGREIYFHEDSVVEADFAHLQVGQEVTFVEQAGDKGPQASTVRPVGRHHHA